MHDNWLLAIAMSVSALGIVGLLFALNFLEVPLSTIPNIAADVDGQTVRVAGDVVRNRQAGNLTILTISQATTIDIVIDEQINSTTTNPSNSGADNNNGTINNSGTSNVLIGSCIVVRGKKSTYRNQSQISATRITTCTKTTSTSQRGVS